MFIVVYYKLISLLFHTTSMSIGGSTGQVLGATSSIAAGVAVLPHTGVDSLTSLLPIVAITVGVVTLAVLVTTRIIRAFL